MASMQTRTHTQNCTFTRTFSNLNGFDPLYFALRFRHITLILLLLYQWPWFSTNIAFAGWAPSVLSRKYRGHVWHKCWNILRSKQRIMNWMTGSIQRYVIYRDSTGSNLVWSVINHCAMAGVAIRCILSLRQQSFHLKASEMPQHDVTPEESLFFVIYVLSIYAS